MRLKIEIDKQAFVETFGEYLKIKDRQESDLFYSRYVHSYLVKIVKFVTGNWWFNCVDDYKDMEAELLTHLYHKKNKGSLSNYKGNLYNVVYTIFKNRFLDLKRTEKIKKGHRDNFESSFPLLVKKIDQINQLR